MQVFLRDFSRALLKQIHPGDSQYRSESVSLQVNCFFDPFLVPWRGINLDVRPSGSFSHPSWNHYNIMTEQGQVKSLSAPVTLLQQQPAWEKKTKKRKKPSRLSNAKYITIHSVSSDYIFFHELGYLNLGKRHASHCPIASSGIV